MKHRTMSLKQIIPKSVGGVYETANKAFPNSKQQIVLTRWNCLVITLVIVSISIVTSRKSDSIIKQYVVSGQSGISSITFYACWLIAV